jgi:hypothetical protein
MRVFVAVRGTGRDNHNISARQAKPAVKVILCSVLDGLGECRQHQAGDDNHSGDKTDGIDRQPAVTAWPVGPRLAIGPDHGCFKVRRRRERAGQGITGAIEIGLKLDHMPTRALIPHGATLALDA